MILRRMTSGFQNIITIIFGSPELLPTIYEPIVILILLLHHGNDNSEIVIILLEIKNILHRYRVEVLSFLFDFDKEFEIIH